MPKFSPPPSEVRALGVAGCSQEEAASFFDVGISTFKRLLKESAPHRRAWDDGVRKRNAQLRAAQMKVALSGNPTMQIWLGKQMLGQREPGRDPQEPGAPPVVVQQTNVNAASAEIAEQVGRMTHEERVQRVQQLLASARARLAG